MTMTTFRPAETQAEVTEVTKPKARAFVGVPSGPDRIFRAVARGSGILVLAIMGLVGIFLTYRALDALRVGGLEFLTTEQWDPDAGAGRFGIAAVLVGTILIALVAIACTIPMAVGTALFISEYAPRRFKRALITVVDLMAAVPSIVFGLWGAFFLSTYITDVARWFATYFGWIPIFQVDNFDPDDPLTSGTVFTASTFIAGVVVSLMVTPITTSVMREVFSQAPAGEREGAYALGATKWGMIRSVVLPFGKGGMIGGTMLGLGRALGETIAVYMIISPTFQIQTHVLQAGGSSVSSLIALRYGEATPFGTSALMAAGLALFLITLVINFVASTIVQRSRSGAASE